MFVCLVNPFIPEEESKNLNNYYLAFKGPRHVRFLRLSLPFGDQGYCRLARPVLRCRVTLQNFNPTACQTGHGYTEVAEITLQRQFVCEISALQRRRYMYNSKNICCRYIFLYSCLSAEFPALYARLAPGNGNIFLPILSWNLPRGGCYSQRDYVMRVFQKKFNKFGVV